MKKVFLMGFSLVMLVLIPLTGNTETLKPQYGGFVKHDTPLARVVGYPSAMAGFTDLYESFPAIEPLFRYDEQFNIVPFLAKSYQISPDKMTIKITLRKGIQFHDGTAFNAEAVKWNLDTYRNSKKPELKSVGSVDILDDYTVQINMAQFESQILKNLCEWAGLMISPTAAKKYGEEYLHTHSVGTGPFILDKLEPGVNLKYKRNNNYWQEGKPYLDGIEFFNIADDMVSLASFKTGEVNIATLTSIEILKQAEAFDEGRVVTLLSVCIGLLGDSIHPDSPFSKLKVRQAVAHAIDVKTFTESLRGKYSQATNQMAKPGTPYYNPNIKGYPYNPEKAKQLLIEAGYPEGFSTTITYPVDKQNDMEMAAIQSYLAKVNIKLELNPVPFPTFLDTRVKGFTGLIHDRVDVSMEREPYSFLMLRLYDKASTYKTSIYFPEDYIETINKAKSEPDYETRMKLNRELVRMVSEKYLIHIPLFLTGNTWFVNKKIHNLGRMEIWHHQCNPEDIWLEK